LGKIKLDNKLKIIYEGGANDAAGNGRGQWHLKARGHDSFYQYRFLKDSYVSQNFKNEEEVGNL